MSLASAPPFRMGRLFHREGEDTTSAGLFAAGATELDEASIRAWLSVGFVPGTRTILKGVSCLPGGGTVSIEDGAWRVAEPYRLERDELPVRLEDLRREVSRRWDEAVARALALPGPHVVPLSGGLDSRILLATLLEHVPAKEILTYTYGVPGSQDYDLGNRVAQVAGTTHIPISLAKPTRWRRDELEEVARLTDANNSLFHPLVWLRVLERVGRTGTWWTGYTGDGIGGSFASKLGSLAESDPVRGFLSFELTTQPSWAQQSGPEELESLCVRSSALDAMVSPVESVWFANHVERYTTHHIYLRGLRYASPFMDESMVRFFCSLPDEHRIGKRFFNEWSSARWPALFGVPTKDYGWALAGGSRTQQLVWQAKGMARKAGYRLFPTRVTHPGTSYWNFDPALRRAPFGSFVRGLLEELDDAGFWSRREWEPLLRAQQAGQRFGTVLLNGASLAIVAGLAARSGNARSGMC